MNKNNNKKLVSKRHQTLELALIINASLYNKGTITKSMFLYAKETLLKLITEEIQKFANI